jgi:hypothetical protein
VLIGRKEMKTLRTAKPIARFGNEPGPRIIVEPVGAPRAWARRICAVCFAIFFGLLRDRVGRRRRLRRAEVDAVLVPAVGAHEENATLRLHDVGRGADVLTV